VTPILEYHRPTTVDAALALLGRPKPRTRPLAGGAHYRRGIKWPEALVDLGELGLDGIERTNAGWEIGAMVTLEALAAAEGLPFALRDAARRQAPRNFRQRSTVGGMIATRDTGALFACFLALQARMTLEPGGRSVALASYAQTRVMNGDLIASVFLPAARRVAFCEISRTPADLPILCVAVAADLVDASTPSAAGPFNFAVTATGADQPLITLGGAAQLLDGAPRADVQMLSAVLPTAAWHDDSRGSADYRNAMLPLLVRRAVADLLREEA
jgi:carbon-monoxide dehydrogenase medium subunit